MSTLTVGEAKSQLEQCRNGMQTLLEKLEVLSPGGIIMDLRAAGGPTVDIPMSKCLGRAPGYLVVEDYVAAMEEIIGWLSDLIEGLDAPDERALAEGEVPLK
jgi:hypothetical protein